VGNRASVTYPNGSTAAYTYDSLNRLTLLENRKSGGVLISSYHYTLGPAGNRLSVVEQSGRTVNYTYDALYRLTQEAITDPALGNDIIGYTYDDFGNRLTKTDSDGTISYTYDANDRLLSEAGPTSIATYTYDDNGNTLSKTEGVETTLYSYDFENRLVGVNTAAGATAYGYDPDGIRVAKSTGTVITRYLVDKNRDYAQVLEETDNGSLTVSYVYGDDLISQNRGSSYYYLYDGQMSTRQLTDGSGNVANTYTYDAFGIVLNQAGVVANNYMYTGEQYDSNAGFYYLRARYYNQGVGRFVTVDPFEGNTFEPVSLHKYLYASNNPVMYTDPSGFMSSLAEAMTVSALVSITMESIAISVESITQHTIPGWEEYIVRYGLAGVVGGLSGSAGHLVGRFATSFLANNIFIKGMGAGVGSGSVAQAIKEFIDWAIYKKPITFTDAKGRVYNAAFSGLILGGISAKVSLAYATPKSYEIVNVHPKWGWAVPIFGTPAAESAGALIVGFNEIVSAFMQDEYINND